jgi:Tn7-like transposition protein D/TniQ
MLSFFPNPYPDELLYSLIARYHIRSGNLSPKITLQEIFNSQTTAATADLPSNLDALFENIKSISNYHVDDLIYKQTLFPFYKPFLPPERVTQVIKSMKAENGGDIHTRIGIMASSITMPRYFRFCPKCLEKDLENYGEPYWHRLQQIPGVLVCPNHRVYLQNSTVPLQGFNKHEYYPASLENFPVLSNQKNYSDDTLKRLCVLAHDIEWLINSNLPSQDVDWFYRQYKSLLINQGLANANGRVKLKQLLDDFIFFYGREMLDAVDSMVDYEDEFNWLLAIVRKHRKSFHPIRHLLFIRFLTGSVAGFFIKNYEYKPFGNAPWLCLNAAAEHYLQPVVTNLTVTHCLENKKPLGTFSCSCGMVYRRTGPDETEQDKLRIGKIIQFGSVWQEKLKKLVEVQQLSLRETARELNVAPRTVCRYVSKLKLTSYWKTFKDNQLTEVEDIPEQNIDSTVDVKLQQREAWLNLQQQHPEASKTTLRKLAPATYTCLYRKDREWLDMNSPSLQKPISSVAKVDWDERDKQILEKAKNSVQLLLDENKPARITISRVGKTIGLLALIEKHIDQMPLTKAYLDSVTETVEDFQIRRIKWAIKQLDDNGEDILRWKVVRVARLREDCSERVKAVLETEIYRKSR